MLDTEMAGRRRWHRALVECWVIKTYREHFDWGAGLYAWQELQRGSSRSAAQKHAERNIAS